MFHAMLGSIMQGSVVAVGLSITCTWVKIGAEFRRALEHLKKGKPLYKDYIHNI